MVRPIRVGTSEVTVSSKGKEIQKTTFRVKLVPNPVTAIQSKEEIKTGGIISEADLLNANGIAIVIPNFDFDINFDVVSCVMTATVPNSTVVREEISHSAIYSELQHDLIRSLIVNQKLIFEEIIVRVPDGSERKVSPIH
jgi:hypothetical protein